MILRTESAHNWGMLISVGLEDASASSHLPHSLGRCCLVVRTVQNHQRDTIILPYKHHLCTTNPALQTGVGTLPLSLPGHAQEMSFHFSLVSGWHHTQWELNNIMAKKYCVWLTLRDRVMVSHWNGSLCDLSAVLCSSVTKRSLTSDSSKWKWKRGLSRSTREWSGASRW
jgi:hypothetical protein